jgi:hypothetical protein
MEEELNFNRPYTYFVVGGSRGVGKSSLLEHIGDIYANSGHCILDLSGAHDGEGLAQLRNPIFEGKNKLLLHGDDVKVIAPGCDTKPVQDFKIRDILDYDLIISSNPLYSSDIQEFVSIAKITDMIFNRRFWTRLVYVIVREAANLYFSRLFVENDQNKAKAKMVYLVREARHCGMAMGMDALRYNAVDIDFRELTDYTLIKRLGDSEIPKTKKWIMSFYKAEKLRRLKPYEFILDSAMGGIAYGWFPEIKWHKQEHEDIISLLNIQISKGDQVFEGTNQGKIKTVGDLEHAEIIRLYVDANLGMDKIADKLTTIDGSSRSNATIHKHITNHNILVGVKGYCANCRRAKGRYERCVVGKGEIKEEKTAKPNIAT